VRRSEPTTVAQAAATAARAGCGVPAADAELRVAVEHHVPVDLGPVRCPAPPPSLRGRHDERPAKGGVVEPGTAGAARHRPGELGPQLGAGPLRLGIGVVAERRALDGDQVAPSGAPRV
jgi:hypothetical protein